MNQVGPGSGELLSVSSLWLELVLLGAAFVDVGARSVGNLFGSSTVSILSGCEDGDNGVSVAAALGSVFAVGGAVAVRGFLSADFVPDFVGLIVHDVHIVSARNGLDVTDGRVSIGVIHAESDGLTIVVIVLEVVEGNFWRRVIGVWMVRIDVQLSDGTARTKTVYILVQVTGGGVFFKLTGSGSSVRPHTLDSFGLDTTGVFWRDTCSSLGWITGGEVSLTVCRIGGRGGWKASGGSEIFAASVVDCGSTGTGEVSHLTQSIRIMFLVLSLPRVHEEVNGVTWSHNLANLFEIGCCTSPGTIDGVWIVAIIVPEALAVCVACIWATTLCRIQRTALGHVTDVINAGGAFFLAAAPDCRIRCVSICLE